MQVKKKKKNGVDVFLIFLTSVKLNIERFSRISISIYIYIHIFLYIIHLTNKRMNNVYVVCVEGIVKYSIYNVIIRHDSSVYIIIIIIIIMIY